MAAEIKGQELILQYDLVERHDLEAGTDLSTGVEVLAGVIQQGDAIENVVLAEISDSVFCFYRLL